MFFNTGKKEECCGCRACANICPKDAIVMKMDDEGFFYPQKNDKCINCGLCEKACPYNPINLRIRDNNLNQEYPIAFAAYGEKERIGSSSGGIFYSIAKRVLSENGIVYGAAFDEELQLHHVSAISEEELQNLRGSKYIQSDIGCVFKEIKLNLETNKYVLFVGTPCQVAGLKSYLNKKYEKLLLIDLICHGVPNQWLFNEHIKYLENKSKLKLINYQFRDNEGWGGCEICNFTNQTGTLNKTVKLPTYELSPYLYSFMYAFTYRYSCYECPFSKIPRQGDITLGDFWGIQKIFPKMDYSKGISSIVINTSKGLKIWDVIKDSLVYKKSDWETVALNNKNLIEHTSKPEIRDGVYQMIKERGYSSIASNEFKSSQYMKAYIKSYIKRIPGVKFLLRIVKK